MILLFTGCRPPAWVFACLVSESMHCFQHFWCPWLLSASLVSGMLWILCPWLLIMAVLRSLCTSGSCLPTLAGLPAWLISYFQLPLPIWRGFFFNLFLKHCHCSQSQSQYIFRAWGGGTERKCLFGRRKCRISVEREISLLRAESQEGKQGEWKKPGRRDEAECLPLLVAQVIRLKTSEENFKQEPWQSTDSWEYSIFHVSIIWFVRPKGF